MENEQDKKKAYNALHEGLLSENESKNKQEADGGAQAAN